MDEIINKYLLHIRIERGYSPRTIEAYRHDLNKFVLFLSERNIGNLDQVKKEDVRDFISRLASNGVARPNSEVSRARKLSSIKSLFKYLSKEELLNKNPAIDIEAPKIPHREASYLSEEEYLSLIRTIRSEGTLYYLHRDLAIVTMFLGTGMRLSELTGLNTADVNLTDQTVRVIGKGNKERTLPLNEAVITSLNLYLKTRPETPSRSLYLSRRGLRMSSGAVYHLIKRYILKSGVERLKVGVHSLRHTFGASLLNNGTNLVVIQELLGHSKLETTRRYLHISAGDMRIAVQQIKFAK